jgi:hypothetical protein
VTGGRVDYIIANAGLVPQQDMFDGLDLLYDVLEKLSKQLLHLQKRYLGILTPISLQGREARGA